MLIQAKLMRFLDYRPKTWNASSKLWFHRIYNSVGEWSQVQLDGFSNPLLYINISDTEGRTQYQSSLDVKTNTLAKCVAS